MSKVHIKKVYGKTAIFPGSTVWYREDIGSSFVWWFDRRGATPLEREDAVKLVVELRANRPDDRYELVPLD